MPVNRNALIRFKTIDNCLRNRYRLWTLEDLIDACSEALYDYEGIDKGVSRRTVQMDIQMMRSDKLGYRAPIIVEQKKFYKYEDPEYSITNIPLTDQDLGTLSEVVDILKQFKGFTHFQELSGMVQKLENKIHVSKNNERPIIDMEKNENLKGLEFIDPIFQAVSKKICLEISYQSFKAREATTFKFHPALLKEWRNRWFVLGKKKPSMNFMMLALDRIAELHPSTEAAMDFESYDIANYFQDVIGATVNIGEEPQDIKLLVYGKHVPYVLTKPLHHSQKVVEKVSDGIVISLRVQHNFELEKEILSFGENIKVLSPARLRSKLKERLSHAIDMYQTDLDEQKARNFGVRLESKGTVIANSVYTKKSIASMGGLMYNFHKNEGKQVEAVYAQRHLLLSVPELIPLIFSQNLKTLLALIDPNLFLTKAIYFDKPGQSNWYVTWHQDTTINVKEKIESEGFTGWTKKSEFFGVCPPDEILKNTVTVRIHLDDTTAENGALQVLPGSHKKRMTDAELNLIVENSLPTTCEVRAGGVHLMKPLLMHASSKTTNNKNRRVIHLEFNSLQLPNGLEWAERIRLDT
jgi:predicted DNA-binding transcriptional regulator YafY/ectoine hydroxylase-related dioxygenase (phytanoyl-CoA dioxygenase family)